MSYSASGLAVSVVTPISAIHCPFVRRVDRDTTTSGPAHRRCQVTISFWVDPTKKWWKISPPSLTGSVCRPNFFISVSSDRDCTQISTSRLLPKAQLFPQTLPVLRPSQRYAEYIQEVTEHNKSSCTSLTLCCCCRGLCCTRYVDAGNLPHWQGHICPHVRPRAAPHGARHKLWLWKAATQLLEPYPATIHVWGASGSSDGDSAIHSPWWGTYMKIEIERSAMQPCGGELFQNRQLYWRLRLCYLSWYFTAVRKSVQYSKHWNRQIRENVLHTRN